METGHWRVGAVPGQVAAGVPRLAATVVAGRDALRSGPGAAGDVRRATLRIAGPAAAGDVRRATAQGIRRATARGIRFAGSPGAGGPGIRRSRSRVPVGVGRHLVRQWRRRKRWNVGFRGGRDEFRERPAAEERRIFAGGITGVFSAVFYLPRTGFRSRMGRFRCPRKATGPHVRPATAAELILRGNGMPVIASPHRSPLSVPALSITRPASVPILGHSSPARRRVDQGVIRFRPGVNVRSRPAHAARLRGARANPIGAPRACRSATHRGPPRRR